MGPPASQPRPDEFEQWVPANQMAWRDGVVLCLLHQLGFLSSEAGTRRIGGEDRPLSGTLFERDPQEYQMTAARLMQATAHVVPDVAKELHYLLTTLGGPLGYKRTYEQLFADAFDAVTSSACRRRGRVWTRTRSTS